MKDFDGFLHFQVYEHLLTVDCLYFGGCQPGICGFLSIIFYMYQKADWKNAFVNSQQLPQKIGVAICVRDSVILANNVLQINQWNKLKINA